MLQNSLSGSCTPNGKTPAITVFFINEHAYRMARNNIGPKKQTEMEPTSYNSLCRQLSNEEQGFTFAINKGLIRKKRNCECGAELSYAVDSRQKFGHRFRCTKTACNKTYSILHGTWFAKSKLPIHDQILLIYCYCLDATSTQLIGMFNFGSRQTAADWSNYFRDICAIYLSECSKMKIGGPGLTVEIDETKIFKRKNITGRLLLEEERGEWLYGGICRETNETFFRIVTDRTEATLMKLLQENVETGTHILSDGWASYRNIPNYGYTHSTVNHSENFVSPLDPNVHTQKIERTWRSVKENIPKSSRYEARTSYILEFSFKKKTNWYALSANERFSLLLSLIARFY
jgi:hypothetical protein